MKLLRATALLWILSCMAAAPLHAADGKIAANAVNTLGVRLLPMANPGGNTVFSPYSLQISLAMIYAGADGKTREEMAKALRYPKNEAALHASFLELRRELRQSSKESDHLMDLAQVNMLYVRKDYPLRDGFLDLIQSNYATEPVPFDPENSLDGAREEMNRRLSEQTDGHIDALIPEGMLTSETRIAVANVIYLKALWLKAFSRENTKPAPFLSNGGGLHDVDTMFGSETRGYAKRKGYAVVELGYATDSEVHFLVLLPDDPKGLPALEAKLTPELLAGCVNLEPAIVKLWLPRFAIDPVQLPADEMLKKAGVSGIFNEPPGSANFSRMIEGNGEGPYVTAFAHQAFISIDEKGTQAGAGTFGFMSPLGSSGKVKKPPEVEMHVDHPFLFAVQDRKSGACLFLGRVTDPDYIPPQKTFFEFFKYRRVETPSDQ